MQKKFSLASMVMSKDENENEKGDGTKTERTGREAKPAKLAVLPTGRRGETPGKESIVKGASV